MPGDWTYDAGSWEVTLAPDVIPSWNAEIRITYAIDLTAPPPDMDPDG